ncbi:MAG: trehalose-phosphatase [Deltaproteobacteria bacterium]|nr:trehalose-phosphatase [Deltaproteobacteria bacterium]
MKNLLGRGQLAALREFVRRRVLLAFDYDGTLAPIVREPEAAAMRPRTAALLARLAQRYPCAVISGRARADVMKMLAGIPLRAVIGNHGMEPWRGLPAARRRVAEWRGRLARALPQSPGVFVEDKGPSLAIHYRQAQARSTVRRRILSAVAELRGARIVEGKMVVNVLPANAPNKGTALLGLCRRLRCAATIYVGDDDNDEDAFALAGRFAVLGIRVSRRRRSQAAYFLPGQAAIDRLLAALIGMR